MSDSNIQNQAIQTYNKNLLYFEKNHKDIYDKLALFETGLNTQQIKPQFDLQYMDNYFELIHLQNNQPFYGKNSVEVSQALVEKSVNFKPGSNSFKTFYEHTYTDEIAKNALNQSIIERYTIGNAPIAHYVQKNLPKDETLTDIHKFILFGLGLGIHVPMIHEKVKAKVYLIVEPSLEIFRLSLFVTDYSHLAAQSNLFFSIAQSEQEFRKTFDVFYGEAFVLNHYLKFFQLVDTCDLYIKTIQNFLVSQSHLLYAYDRTFMSIYRTHQYINDGYNLLNISHTLQLKFAQKPILLLAAGPSLQHNVEFVKENQDKFTIVAIYATLPLLEKHEIKPDIITQYDEQNNQVLNTLDKIQDITFFSHSICLFSSHVNSKLLQAFPKKNTFLFQAMFEIKTGFGMLTAPSIGELSYGLLLILGAKEIYLLGLDFAMDAQTNATHIEGHSGAKGFEELKDLEESEDTQYSYRKNTILIKGNFLPEVKSIPVFKSNIDAFHMLTVQFKPKNCKVYNLSNGAYLPDTIPLPIENIQIASESIITYDNILNELQNISENHYNQKDIDSITLKLSTVKKSKKLLDGFYKIKKYSDLNAYKNKLFTLFHELLFENTLAPDLQLILQNYTLHNMHFVFHLLNVDAHNNFKKHIYELNKAIYTQINKVLMTYAIVIAYSKDSNSLITKKLNKLLKEHKLTQSLFSEPFFKELIETSLNGEQKSFNKNHISFFAIEENLNNKSFTSYIKKLLKEFPNVKLTLFYFFEVQKQLANHIFKQELKRIEFKIPNTIEEITNVTDIWFESTEKINTLKKVDDIILHSYSNIYSIMFNKENKQNIDTKQFKLITDINKKLPLKNSNYYHFCNNLKENIDEKKFFNMHKKEHIGFFAFNENLTRDFIQAILDIYNQFPNLKFVAFYFDEKQKQLFETTFQSLLSRFHFIIPNNIYYIAENIEIWLAPKTKEQIFLTKKLANIFLNTLNIYSTVIDSPFIFENNLDYLNNLVPNYYYLNNYKKFYFFNTDDNYKQPSIQKTKIISCVGTSDNLSDFSLLNYLKSLILQFPYLKVHFFVFDISKEYKELLIFENFKNFKVLEWSNFQYFLDNTHFYLLSEKTNTNSDKIWSYILDNESDIFLSQYSESVKNIKLLPLPKEIIQNQHLFSYNTECSLDEIAIKSAMKDLSLIDNNFKINNFYQFVYFKQIEYIANNNNLASKIMYYRKLIYKILYAAD